MQRQPYLTDTHMLPLASLPDRRLVRFENYPRLGERLMRSLFLFTLLGLVACGGDNGTGPGSSVDGVWSASLSNLSGSGVSCSSTAPTQLTLNQTGNTFSGSYTGGELTCSGPGGTFSDPVGSGSVVNGQINGNSLSFDLDTPDFHQIGTITGNSLSGTAQWRVDFGAPTGVVTLNGNWGAAKQ